MSRSEVYFAIPSANPENCRRTLPVWREMGYKIAVLQDHKAADVPADIIVQYGDYRGWPASVNALCLEVVPRSAAIVVSGGDDMLPDPNYTAEQLSAQFLKRFPDTFGVMQPHGDNFLDSTQYCGSPWLGRAWFSSMYNGRGGLCSHYRHMFADDELYWVAGCWDALWSRPDLTQFHQHFTRMGQAKPDYWEKNAQGSEAADTAMFIARSTLGFPGHAPAQAVAAHSFDPSFFRENYTGRAQRHWNSFFAPQFPTPAETRMAEALSECARRGMTRVVIFGAGRHTLRLGGALRAPPVCVMAIVDDNPALHGKRLWNYPILASAQAMRLEPQAVILSSDSAEDQLAIAAASFVEAGIPVIRLYSKPAAPHQVKPEYSGIERSE